MRATIRGDEPPRLPRRPDPDDDFAADERRCIQIALVEALAALNRDSAQVWAETVAARAASGRAPRPLPPIEIVQTWNPLYRPGETVHN